MCVMPLQDLWFISRAHLCRRRGSSGSRRGWIRSRRQKQCRREDEEPHESCWPQENNPVTPFKAVAACFGEFLENRKEDGSSVCVCAASCTVKEQVEIKSGDKMKIKSGKRQNRRKEISNQKGRYQLSSWLLALWNDCHVISVQSKQ